MPIACCGSKMLQKVDKDPGDVVCAFIDKYITAVIPPVTSENEHQIKLMDSATETYTF